MLNWFKSNHHALTAIGAMVVGLAALFVAWDQARVMRAQQHSQVWPAVQIETELAREEDRVMFEVSLTNDGIGPALVERVDARFAGEALVYWEQMGELRPEALDRPVMWSSAAQGDILAPGQSLTLARMSWAADAADADAIREYQTDFFDLEITICFCSVYGRCWEARRDRRPTHPDPVEQCRPADPESFL